MWYQTHHSQHKPSLWKDYNHVSNYPVKTSHNNPVPSFKFPTRESTSTPETTTVEQITKTIKDIIAPFTSTTEATTELITTTQNNILNATSGDIVDVAVSEAINDSANTIFNIAELTTSSAMTDIMQNSSFPLNGTNVMDNSGTILTEVASSTVANAMSALTTTTEQALTTISDAANATAATLTTTTEQTLTTISEAANATASNTVAIINTTTQKVTTFVSNTLSEMSKTEGTNKDGGQHYYHYNMGSHRMLYVILLVILAILISIGVVVLLIYIRYRKTTSNTLNHYYEVSPMKERTPSNSNHSQEEQKSCPTEVYMHYHC